MIRSRALRAGFVGPGGQETLFDDPLQIVRVLLKIEAETLVNGALDDTLHFGIAQFGLGLAFELRLRKPDAEDRRQPFPDVFSGKAGIVFLEEFALLGVAVQYPGKGGPEARQVSAAVRRVDAVGEGADRLRKAVVILQGGFDRDAVGCLGDVDRIAVLHHPVPVEVPHEAGHAALKVECVGGILGFIEQGDLEHLVKVRDLPQPLQQGFGVIAGVAEYLLIGQEGGGGAGITEVPGFAHDLELALRDALLVFLPVYLAVPLDVHPQPGGEGVDRRSADAMQSAADLVMLAAEFGAGMQRGHDRFQGGLLGYRMGVHGNAAAVVLDLHVVVVHEGHRDLVAAAGHGFVDAVVDDLVDKVLEPALVGAPDIHAGPAPHGFQTAQHLDILGGIVVTSDCLAFIHKARSSSHNIMLWRRHSPIIAQARPEVKLRGGRRRRAQP